MASASRVLSEVAQPIPPWPSYVPIRRQAGVSERWLSRRRGRIAIHRAAPSADVLSSVGRSHGGEARSTFQPSWKATLVGSQSHPDRAGWGLSSLFIAAIWLWSFAIFASAMALVWGASGGSCRAIAFSRSSISWRMAAISWSIFRDTAYPCWFGLSAIEIVCLRKTSERKLCSLLLSESTRGCDAGASVSNTSQWRLQGSGRPCSLHATPAKLLSSQLIGMRS